MITLWSSLTRKQPIERQVYKLTHIPLHLCEGLLSNSEDVRVEVAHGVPPVRCDGVRAVDGQLLVRVDGHQYDAWSTYSISVKVRQLW